MPAGKFIKKRLSTRAHATILKHLAQRDEYLSLAEALSQSVERIIEQDCGVNLDKQHWELDVQEGCITRVVEVLDA